MLAPLTFNREFYIFVVLLSGLPFFWRNYLQKFEQKI